MDRSFAAVKEQALRHFEMPGGADKLKAYVESCWENYDCIEAASAGFIDFTHRNDIFTALGEAQGYKFHGPNHFRRQLSAKGIRRIKNVNHYYVGLRLTTAEDSGQ